MTRIVVAGVVSICATVEVPSFPVPYVASRRATNGIGMGLTSVGWTTARALQRLGTSVSLATYVGADALGQLAIHGLREHGLYGSGTLVCPRQPRVVVLHDHDGRRSGVRDHPFTTASGFPADVFASILDSGEPCDLALLTSVGFTNSLVPAVMDRGISIATDLQLVTDIDSSPYQDRMAVADILACSHERLSVTPESLIVQLWQRFGTDIVLVGCGASGAVLGIRAGRRIWRVDAIAPRVVRCTGGAGDVLLASFIHHHGAIADPLVAAQHAVLAAGWHVGGEPGDDPGPTATTMAELRISHGLPVAHRLR